MKRIILSICATALFFSCSNDDDNSGCNEGTTQAEANFYALKLGNSWTYKNYTYNNNTQEYEYSGVIDSVKITGTEIINDNTYFEFTRRTSGNNSNNVLLNPNGTSTELLRDSLGYLIWETGKVKFANNDFSERTLNEQAWGTIFETLQTGSNDFVVEAGIFPCINSERYAKSNPDGTLLPGLDKIYYSDGIGLVFETVSFVSSNIPVVERRLDAYSVE
jgi:hypothetical protein